MKFVIISQPRSGTSMIVNTLNFVKGINVYGELFMNTNNLNSIPHKQKIQRDMINRIMENSYHSSNKSVEKFLDNIYNQDYKAIGFKLLSPHLKRKEGKEITRYIQFKNIFKFIIYRKNKFKQIISSLTNRKKDVIKINPKNIVKRTIELLEDEKNLHNTFCNGNYIKKSYEEITNNNDVKEIDISWIPGFKKANVMLRKYRPNKISDNISNFNEFKTYVKNNNQEYLKWID